MGRQRVGKEAIQMRNQHISVDVLHFKVLFFPRVKLRVLLIFETFHCVFSHLEVENHDSTGEMNHRVTVHEHQTGSWIESLQHLEFLFDVLLGFILVVKYLLISLFSLL